MYIVNRKSNRDFCFCETIEGFPDAREITTEIYMKVENALNNGFLLEIKNISGNTFKEIFNTYKPELPPIEPNKSKTEMQLEFLGQENTDRELENIAQGQKITDLELKILGLGGTNNVK